MTPIILVHGGAAIIAKERVCGKMCGIREAAKVGHNVLSSGTALDAVEAAIRYMETDQFFNAGFGSVLNGEGSVEMDASIMDGDMSSGACTGVTNVEHPISLARLIKEQSPHILMAGEGASAFAKSKKMKLVPPASMISDYSREILKVFKQKGNSPETRELGGTVGAVALDKFGNVAAGTSTGGTNGKLKGRIGDTPLIGCGTFANNECGACSCTGHGEAIIRMGLSRGIISELLCGKRPQIACEKRVQELTDITGSTVGAICLDVQGNVGKFCTTVMMPWAYIKGNQMHTGLYPDDDQVQPFGE